MGYSNVLPQVARLLLGNTVLWNSKKPEIMNKKQMQIASQISKRKALHPPCAKDEKKLQCYYEGKIAVLPDVIDVTTAVDFTGYNHRTVCQWIRVGKRQPLFAENYN